MGAELLIHSIAFKAKDRCLIDKSWAQRAFAQARQNINAIDHRRMVEIQEDQEDAHADVGEYKRALLRDLAELRSAVFGYHRQAATVIGGEGIILLLSGGTSWGDPPTELFQAVTRLLEANVLSDARWPPDAQSQPSTRT